MSAMRMRQSLDELEQAFSEEISNERTRRKSLIRTAEHRSRQREVARRRRMSSMRFVALVLALILTAVAVTVVMFRVLYLLLA